MTVQTFITVYVYSIGACMPVDQSLIALEKRNILIIPINFSDFFFVPRVQLETSSSLDTFLVIPLSSSSR